MRTQWTTWPFGLVACYGELFGTPRSSEVNQRLRIQSSRHGNEKGTI